MCQITTDDHFIQDEQNFHENSFLNTPAKKKYWGEGSLKHIETQKLKKELKAVRSNVF